jgi:hypothetical protein
MFLRNYLSLYLILLRIFHVQNYFVCYDKLHMSALFQDCDWIFEEKTCVDDGNRCQIASPGYPGVYPPRRKCRYLFKMNKGSTIRLNFTHFNLPPE